MRAMMQVVLAVDQEGLRSALRLFLDYESNMSVVEEVGNVGALLAATARLRPHLILLDWGLVAITPLHTHRQLIATVRALQPQVYILALTGTAAPSCDLLSVDAFVSKAEPPDRVLAALRQAKAASAHHRQSAFCAPSWPAGAVADPVSIP
jgi:DNA-binding NarL/FixJ family response regulator